SRSTRSGPCSPTSPIGSVHTWRTCCPRPWRPPNTARADGDAGFPKHSPVSSLEGDLEGDHRAHARGGVDVEPPARGVGAFGEVPQAAPGDVGGNAAAVVAHTQPDLAVVAFERHPHLTRPRVTHHIGQCLAEGC